METYIMNVHRPATAPKFRKVLVVNRWRGTVAAVGVSGVAGKLLIGASVVRIVNPTCLKEARVGANGA